MKRLFNIVFVIIILYVVLAFFGPKHIHLERSILINRSSDLVKTELSNFKNFHEHWSPWSDKDTAMKVTYSGEPGTLGSKYSWNGNAEVGEGSIEYLGWTGDTLKEKITFGAAGDSKLNFIVTTDSGETKVTWAIDVVVGFLRRPFMLFIPMEKFLAEDFEHGLQKLKKAVESQVQTQVYNIETQNMPAMLYVGIKETVMFADMTAFYARAYQELFSDKNIVPKSAPSSIFLTYDATAGKAEILACVAVDKQNADKKYAVVSYPASKAVLINYYGPYEKVGPAHDQLARYVQEQKLTTLGVIEEYVTDPKLEKDPSKWLTKIYYLCK